MFIASRAFEKVRQIAVNEKGKLSSTVRTGNAEISNLSEIHAEDANRSHEPIMPQNAGFTLLSAAQIPN